VTRPDGENRLKNRTDSVRLRPIKLIGGGRALAHHEGETWMIAGALPGELVTACETGRRAGIVEARTLAVLDSPHPAREADPCPHAGRCGGCDWPHVEAAAAARLKAGAAAEAARAFPELATMVAEATINKSPLGSRLRARLHWNPQARTLGFYESRSHTVTPIPRCRILSPGLMRALPAITETLARHCPERVDLEWLEGTEPENRIAALRPVKGGPARIDRQWLSPPDEMQTVVRGFHGLSRAGSVEAGWGTREVLMGLPIPLMVPIGAFFQGNRHLIEPLFRRVAELATSAPDPVFDLHAGVGYLAAAVRSAGAREMFLVEPHAAAAMAAAQNLPEASVAAGVTAEEFLPAFEPKPPNALVVTDPPRTGMTSVLRRALVEWRPRRVLMLGCDPATWARDAGFLCERGYRLAAIELFDLFPSTHHIEILALLELG
jgi:23S rRNA (uracil1939-C5)-methyltransferase